MTHQPLPVPPPTSWPSTSGPDCPACQSTDQAHWLGVVSSLDYDTDAHLWQCHACCAEWAVPTTSWPVLDGPDCPVCETPVTRWQAIDADHLGDTWTCEAGHEFVLDPEGFIYVPPAGENA